MMIKTLSLLMLLQTASSMNIKVEDWECRDFPITISFDRVCTQDDVCTTGKQSNIEGTLTYYGMYDQYGLNDESIIYLDLNMSLFALGYESDRKPIYNATLFNMAQFPICHETISKAESNYNNKGCPASGDYKFQSSITVPSPGNSFTSWMYTGYTGVGELAIYKGQGYGSKLLGYCSLKLSTETESNNAAGVRAPSGKATMISVLSAVAAMLLFACIALYCACKKGKKGNGELNKLGKDVPLDEKIAGKFKMLEEETRNEAKRSWHLDEDDNQSKASSRSKRIAMKESLLDAV